MANDYYDNSDPGGRFMAGETARGSDVDSKFDEVAAGFDKLPSEALLKTGAVTFGSENGTANSYVVSLPYPIGAYAAGLSVRFKATHANSGAATIDVDGVGIKNIIRQDGTALRAGDIPNNSVVTVTYDGVAFRLDASTSKMVSDAEAAAAGANAAASVASNKANAAEASAASAANSQNSAAQSASNAGQSESNSAASASAAAASRAGAADSASSAALSASAAHESASNAAGSASAADSAAASAYTSAGQAATSANAAAMSASNSSQSESSAEGHANSAGSSASTASTKAQEATTSASSAHQSQLRAEQWADKATDTEVEPGRYSARHWAEKAAQAVSEGVIDDDAISPDFTWSSEKLDALIKQRESKWSIVATSANTTAVPQVRYMVNTSAGAVTLTLPDTPSNGDKIGIVDATGSFGTHNCVINRNGKTIMGLAENMNIDIENAAIDLIYFGGDWRVF